MEETKEVSKLLLDQKITRQVEYYFGDFNLPRDKFLQEQIKLDDGWIPLSTMLNFKRLAAITTDEDIIISALKNSPVKLIEVDAEKKKIRRSLEKPVPEMTESRQKELQARTVYCKGITKENLTLDRLLEYFAQFGSVDNIQMRSYLDKATKEYIFKGSVFVVFSTKDEAEEFLKKESVEYEGVKLLLKWQEDYFLDKKKEREDKKKMQKAKVQQATTKQPQSTGIKSQDDEDKDSDEEEEEKEEKEEKEQKGTNFAKGAMVHMKNIPKNATWEDIKSAVTSVWKDGAKEGEDADIVAYVDFRMGNEEAWVRLLEADTATTLLQRAKAAAKSSKKMDVDKDMSSGDAGNVKAEEVNGVEKGKEAASDGGEAGETAVVVKKENCSGDGDKKGVEAGETAVVVKKENQSEDGDKKVVEAGETAVVVKKENQSEDEDKNDVEKDRNESCIKVCGAVVSIRALEGSEEEDYLEKARGEREKKINTTGRNRKRGGYGGNRRGRGGRGGKRKHNWEGGPSHKRRR